MLLWSTRNEFNDHNIEIVDANLLLVNRYGGLTVEL